MSRLINVFVCNSEGYGLSNQKVKLYRGDPVYTDSNGKAALFADSDSISVYVNGNTAYEGSTSRAPNPIVYKK